MTEKLILKDYDPNWVIKFDEESKNIFKILTNDTVHKIHHVGSTSIAGMKSKSIIDMAIEIKQYPPSVKVVELLESIGYKNEGECGVPGRYWFTKGFPREFHLHLTPIDGDVVRSLLKFRDVLRKSKLLQVEYMKIKEKFNGHHELDSHEYNLHKAPFVTKVLLDKGT
ncbi:MAG: GrpB family protein [Bacteriovoracaceae bacterium]|nr:GrpB family protein [Bacteriovoracaceae bacterium]